MLARLLECYPTDPVNYKMVNLVSKTPETFEDLPSILTGVFPELQVKFCCHYR